MIDEEALDFVKSVLPKEWIREEIKKDYGIDLTVEIVLDEQVTGAYFSIQLKGTDKLKVRQAGYIAHSCETKTLRYFLERPELVIYLVYDAEAQKGYWIWVQGFIRQEFGKISPNWRQQNSATIRIPLSNTFDSETVKQISQRVLRVHKSAKWLSAIETAQNPYFKYDLKTSGRGFEIDISTRYPGAEKDFPVTTRGTFKFDESPEAQAALRDLELVIKTGATVEIPSQFFEGFGIPEAFSDLFAELGPLQFGKLRIGTAKTDERFIARLIILDADERLLFELPYDIVFQVAQAGTEEVTYSNEEQDIPFRVEMRFNFREETGFLTIQQGFRGRNVVQIRNFLQIQPALAQGGRPILRFPDTGLDLEFELPGDFVFDEDFVNIINALAFIQEKTGQTILWPGEISSDETQMVQQIREVLQTGYILIKRPELHWDLGKAEAQGLAKAYEDEETIQLNFEEQDHQTYLFGAQLSLGPYRIIVPNAKLKQTARQQLNNIDQVPDDTILPIDLEVGEPGIILAFQKWLPPVAESAIEEHSNDPTSPD